MTAVDPTVCAACGTAVHVADRFCEVCGTPLASASGPAGAAPSVDVEAVDEPDEATAAVPGPRGASGATACRACGGRVAADGYCEQCGTPAASPRDHWTQRPADWVGGVCDRGVRHSRNEDAMALAAGEAFAALVVCDGVSTAPNSDVASAAAAQAALDVLTSGGPGGDAPVTGTGPARAGAWSELLDRAAVAGDDAIRATVVPGTADDDVPSCTFVAAVLDHELLVVGWLGDSRAYWLPDAGPAEQLSADDSWAGDLVRRGVPREAAEASPQAHAITRWLGPDATDVDARTTVTLADEPGWVLVCSDGLWNYCSPAQDVATLVRDAAADCGDDPERTAGALVAWANAQGGRDNVTVALARVAGPATPAPGGTSSDSLDAGGSNAPTDRPKD